MSNRLVDGDVNHRWLMVISTVLSHPYGWIDHRYMNDGKWVIDGIIWIGVSGEMEVAMGWCSG